MDVEAGNGDGRSISASPRANAVRTPRLSREDVEISGPDQQWVVPREVNMEARLGSLVMAFQSNQQVSAVVDAAYAEQITFAEMSLASQWRLVSPRPKSGVLPADTRTVLAIVEKLLTRGTLSYTSIAIEEFINTHSRAGVPAYGKTRVALHAMATEPTCPHAPSAFDSDEERAFVEWFLDQGSSWSIVEQVDLGAILGGRGALGDERRVDFLLVSPGGDALVVEVDGEQHSSMREADAARDEALMQSAIPVIRIPASEVREGVGPNLTGVGKAIRDGDGRPSADTALTLAIRLGKLAHQVQVALVEALMSGWLRVDGPWVIGLEPPVSDAVDPSLVHELVYVAAQDCAELVRRIGRLYGAEMDSFPVTVEQNAGSLDIVLSFGDYVPLDSSAPRFTVSDIRFPGRIAAPRVNAAMMNAANPDREDVRYFLQYLFRKGDFREGQWETIQRTLCGLDSIVLLPTGGGKSIAFQLSALLRPGCCIVIDPILSLIEDQIDNLAKAGIDRCLEISSAVDRYIRTATTERMANYLFIYVAPERFQMEEFRDELRALTQSVPISQLAIDEAHCVSEWGHDFRTSYLRLGRNAREYCKSQGAVPPIVALTGTASRMVLKNIQLDLDIRDFNALVTPKSFDRQELDFNAVQALVDESVSVLDGRLQALPGKFELREREFFKAADINTNSIIVFTSTINTPTGTEAIAAHLRQRLPVKVGTYSGSAPRGRRDDWNATKKTIARDFKHNKIPLLVATNAYGMGIDKPNVRSTIHLGLPHSIESFYQESGRAGRDGNKAICEIVFAMHANSARLLDPVTPITEIVDALDNLPRSQQDDVHQALWFHAQAFRGDAAEKNRLRLVVDKLGNIGQAARVRCAWTRDGEEDSIEKALHRLSIVGVIADYEKDYSGHQFVVRLQETQRASIIDNLCAYISDYQSALSISIRQDMETLPDLPLPDFAIRAGEKLVDFVYEHVEQARRRALFEMLQAALDAASNPDGGERMRLRVLRHLEWSEFDDVLERVISSAHAGLDVMCRALEQTDSPTAADSLRGAVARLLESYPDQPALLLLRGVAEALARSTDWEVVRDSFRAALNGLATYRIASQELIADALAQCVNKVSEVNAGVQVVEAITADDLLDIETAQLLIARIPEEATPPLTLLLTQNLLTSARQISEVYRDKQQH